MEGEGRGGRPGGQPDGGLEVQPCGDAHLSNFGGFASPERQLLFGLNDFDEALPGPFEDDLKRMAARFTIAARNNNFSTTDASAVTAESVKAYRVTMAEFSAMRTLDVWYAHMSEQHIQEAMQAFQDEASPGEAKPRKGKSKGKSAKRKQAPKAGNEEDSHVAEAVKTGIKTLRKAHTRDSLHALGWYAEVVDGRYRIVSEPPVVVPLRELEGSWEHRQTRSGMWSRTSSALTRPL